MKIAIISLGCPKNQVDADVFCHALIKDGHTTVADPAEADIIIINTCGFIESAKTEAIENILMACQYKQENPDLKVIVTGCLAERYKQQIIQEIPEVDAVVGIGSNAALPAIVRRVCADGAGQTESYGPKSDMQLGGARVISTPPTARTGADPAPSVSCWTACRKSTASAGSASCTPIRNVSATNLSPPWSATPRSCPISTCPSSTVMTRCSRP